MEASKEPDEVVQLHSIVNNIINNNGGHYNNTYYSAISDVVKMLLNRRSPKNISHMNKNVIVTYIEGYSSTYLKGYTPGNRITEFCKNYNVHKGIYAKLHMYYGSILHVYNNAVITGVTGDEINLIMVEQVVLEVKDNLKKIKKVDNKKQYLRQNPKKDREIFQKLTAESLNEYEEYANENEQFHDVVNTIVLGGSLNLLDYNVVKYISYLLYRRSNDMLMKNRSFVISSIAKCASLHFKYIRGPIIQLLGDRIYLEMRALYEIVSSAYNKVINKINEEHIDEEHIDMLKLVKDVISNKMKEINDIKSRYNANKKQKRNDSKFELEIPFQVFELVDLELEQQDTGISDSVMHVNQQQLIDDEVEDPVEQHDEEVHQVHGQDLDLEALQEILVQMRFQEIPKAEIGEFCF